ncbi:hypothetical protein BDZ45DRAFT_750692 [Acephala macrosclerotiorum]|nr:hypothetical protein BDZ45DRAFT_750692 [Acephala macrosclerotiorum]
MAVISTSFSSAHKLAAAKIAAESSHPSPAQLEHTIQTIDQNQLRLAVLELCRTNPEAAKSLSPLISSAPAMQANKRSAPDNTLISARPRKVLATRTQHRTSSGFNFALQPRNDVNMNVNEFFGGRLDGCCKSTMMENARAPDVEMMWHHQIVCAILQNAFPTQIDQSPETDILAPKYGEEPSKSICNTLLLPEARSTSPPFDTQLADVTVGIDTHDGTIKWSWGWGEDEGKERCEFEDRTFEKAIWEVEGRYRILRGATAEQYAES